MPKRRANGEGSIYRRKDGTWTAQYTDYTGKVRYMYGKTQQAVRDKLRAALYQKELGVVIDARKITFSDWVKEWLDTYHKPFVRPSTYQKDLAKWNHHIMPYWGSVPLKNVRHETLQKFLNEKLEKRLDGKKGGYSVGAVSEMKNIMGGALRKAVDLGYIPRNPADGLRLPVNRPTERMAYTPEQQKVFEKAVRAEMECNHNHSIFLLMLYTGLRAGEALGLQIKDVDFKNKELHVRRTVGIVHDEEAGGVTFYARGPKTRTGARVIPIPPSVEAILAEQIKHRNLIAETLAERWEDRGTDMTFVNEGYLYITIQGGIMGQANTNKAINRIISNAGLPHLSLHGLRHTFATRWLEAGLDVKTLSEILGHADTKMTLNIYTHALPAQKRKNMEAISKLLGEMG